MDTIEAIRTRRSIRSFSSRSINEETLQEILQDARAAPSAGNLQARDFIVIRKQEKKNRIAQAALNQRFLAGADVLVVVCANRRKAASYGSRGTDLYCIQDADAAVMTMLLSIHARGLASVWIGAFDEKQVSELLNLPDHARPVAIVPIGYHSSDLRGAGGSGGGSRRQPLEDMVHYGEW